MNFSFPHFIIPGRRDWCPGTKVVVSQRTGPYLKKSILWLGLELVGNRKLLATITDASSFETLNRSTTCRKIVRSRSVTDSYGWVRPSQQRDIDATNSNGRRVSKHNMLNRFGPKTKEADTYRDFRRSLQTDIPTRETGSTGLYTKLLRWTKIIERNWSGQVLEFVSAPLHQTRGLAYLPV